MNGKDKEENYPLLKAVFEIWKWSKILLEYANKNGIILELKEKR